MDFQRLARPRNVSVDLKYDVLCLLVFGHTRLSREEYSVVHLIQILISVTNI